MNKVVSDFIFDKYHSKEIQIVKIPRECLERNYWRIPCVHDQFIVAVTLERADFRKPNGLESSYFIGQCEKCKVIYAAGYGFF